MAETIADDTDPAASNTTPDASPPFAAAASHRGMYYEPYYCLGTLLTTPEAIRTTPATGRASGQRLDAFLGRVERYRVERERFARWSAGEPLDPVDGETPVDKLDAWLFRPLSLTVLGFLDEVALQVIDTPDAYFRFYGQDGLSATQVSLAAVPRLDRLDIPTRGFHELPGSEHSSNPDWQDWLGRQDFDPRLMTGRGWEILRDGRSPFVRLQDLFHNDWAEDCKEHPLEIETPLVAFARLRMGSLSALGGNIFRRAFHRAIARTVVRTQLELLRRMTDSADVFPPLASRFRRACQLHRQLGLWEPGAREADALRAITDLTIAVTDPLGVEECGLLIGSKNFSVTMAIHTAIQALTFEDIREACDAPCLEQTSCAQNRLEEHLRASRVHQSIRRTLSEREYTQDEDTPNEQTPGSDDDALLLNNHALSVTHTTVGTLRTTWAALVNEAHRTIQTQLGNPNAPDLMSVPCLNGETDGEADGGTDGETDGGTVDLPDATRIRENIRGVMEGYVRAGHVSAGHAWEVERAILGHLNTFHTLVRPQLPCVRVSVWQNRVARGLLGRHDLDWSVAWSGRPQMHVLGTADLIALSGYVARVLGEGGPGAENASGGEEGVGRRVAIEETGLSDLTTSVVIPSPQWDADRDDQAPDGSQPEREPVREGFPARRTRENHVPMMAALEQLCGRLFDEAGPLDSKLRERTLTYLRLPARLHRIIETLFVAFREAVGDPLLFDHVLDLLDCFEALQVFLTRDLPIQVLRTLDSRWSDLADPPNLDEIFRWLDRMWDGTVDQATVLGLGDYCDALANALSQRLYFESQLDYAEWSISTLRGGLVQLVHAASTVLRSGVGLFRFALESDFGSRRDIMIDRNSESFGNPLRLTTPVSLGFVPRLTVYERTDARRLHPGMESRARLEAITFEIGHLANPTEFGRYLHEVAHAIMFAWIDHDGPIGPSAEQLESDRTEDRIFMERWGIEIDVPIRPDHDTRINDREELFAVALTQVFIHGDKWKLGQGHRLASYASSPHSGSISTEAAHWNLLQHLLISFFATAPFASEDIGCGPSVTFPALHSGPQETGETEPPDPACQHPLAQYAEASLEYLLIDLLPKFYKFCQQLPHVHSRSDTFLEWLRQLQSFCNLETLHRLNQQLDRRTADQLVTIAKRMRAYASVIADAWWRVVTIYRAYVRWFWPGLTPEHIEMFDEIVTNALNEGQSSADCVRAEFLARCHAEARPDSPVPELRDELDELLITTRIIHALVKSRLNIETASHRLSQQLFRPSVHRAVVIRDEAFHEVGLIPEQVVDMFEDVPTSTPADHLRDEARPPKASWIMTDRRYSRYHALAPLDRTQLIRQEIASLRMLWGLSCRQRSRRLVRMFDAACALEANEERQRLEGRRLCDLRDVPDESPDSLCQKEIDPT